MNEIRIDHFNAFSSGGAAIAARRVHEGLRHAGLESTFWYARGPEVEDPTYRRWAPQKRSGLTGVLDRVKRGSMHAVHRLGLKRALRGRPDGLELFSTAESKHKFAWTADAFADADVLHLHWVGSALDYRTFFSSTRPDQPIVWTLHDMNAFTGGCHYNNGCTRFQDGCGRCPQLGKPADEDLSRKSFDAKIAALPLERIHIVAPSKWLLNEARNSTILHRAAGFHLIPYGIDLKRFQPRDREDARRQLGLPGGRPIIAFGADDVNNRRKGVRQLCESLAKLQTPETICIYFGRGELPAIENPHVSLEMRPLGFISDPEQLALVYSAADVFLMPSLEDNLPQTGIESIACGTQVAAFDAGGVPDFVIPGQSGQLAAVGDSDAFAGAIQSLLRRQYVGGQRTRESIAMRQRARLVAESMFQPTRQAAAYTSLYCDLLYGHSSRAAA